MATDSKQQQQLPIVYVRGFAGGTSSINLATDDPFYGFNLGSTHVRVGRNGDPFFYQFESPLLRLMIEHQYEVFGRGSQEQYLDAAPKGTVNSASIWIHRFYDVSASTFGAKPKEFSLITSARELFELIKKLKEKTGAGRVHLVAHSMGGLICRCLIQKIIPEAKEKAPDHVDRLFTYGTPHGGISFDLGFGLIERLRDEFGPAGSEMFTPELMFEYLTPGSDTAPGNKPGRGWRPNVMSEEVFPLHRVFCLVGTNPEDYDVALGLSAKAVGPKSDGLVQIENAYLEGANHAFVHRSHSGRYGMVNSEEGYQNLSRFLFGDVKVTADLVGLPSKVLRPNDDVVWQAEVRMSVRGLPVVMAERLAAHHCPVQLSEENDSDNKDPADEEESSADRPVPLVTTYLWKKQAFDPKKPMRFVFHLRIISLHQENGIFKFLNHLEQTADFDDVLVVDVGQDGTAPAVWAEWRSRIKDTLEKYAPTGQPLKDEQPEDPTSWVAHVELPVSAGFLGDKARVRLTALARS